MLLRFFFFILLIHFGILINNYGDLSIPNYFHIGCLSLKSDKQFMKNNIQENPFLPYQTWSSSNTSVELCFRLCRKWTILIDRNHTICICLYTMNELYEFNNYLGKVLSINHCTSVDLQIYSLTRDFRLLPSLSLNYDWSFDGCYYLHGIQAYRANLLFNYTNYIQAIDMCRQHCQIVRHSNYFSFFLSLKKSCYCLPILFTRKIKLIGVRKSLKQCSFLSHIKNRFANTSLNYSKINSDTVVKLNVQCYCLSKFIFDRNLYLCLKLIPFDGQNTYLKTITTESCSPISIETYEQWKHLISLSLLSHTRTFMPIHPNSTYIFDDLFKSKYSSLTLKDLCIVVNETNSTRLLSFDLVSCSSAESFGFVLCSHKPLNTSISNETDLNMP